MPRISNEKKEKIQEQLLFFLFGIFPKQVFTSDIAKELARDEEFMKVLLHELEKKDLVVKVDKNSEGVKYERRARWRISNGAYEIYSQHQQKQKDVQRKIEQSL